MAKNDLTPLQDVTTREFLVEVALAENVLDNNPATKRRLLNTLYQLLNYQRLRDGRFVSKDAKLTYKLGGEVSMKDYPDEWSSDYARAIDALKKGDKDANRKVKAQSLTTNYNDSDEANSGKQTEDTSFWKTVLRKDL